MQIYAAECTVYYSVLSIKEDSSEKILLKIVVTCIRIIMGDGATNFYKYCT